jgi:cellobiose phosphorylase
MYQFITGSLLGLRIEVNKLHFNPRIPSTWTSFKVHYRYRETVYHITILRLLEPETESSIVLMVAQAERSSPSSTTERNTTRNCDITVSPKSFPPKCDDEKCARHCAVVNSAFIPERLKFAKV